MFKIAWNTRNTDIWGVCFPIYFMLEGFTLPAKLYWLSSLRFAKWKSYQVRHTKFLLEPGERRNLPIPDDMDSNIAVTLLQQIFQAYHLGFCKVTFGLDPVITKQVLIVYWIRFGLIVKLKKYSNCF